MTPALWLGRVRRRLAQGVRLQAWFRAIKCRDQRVVEKLQDVLLSKPEDIAHHARARGVSEAVLHAEWLEWASACAARVAQNQDVSIMMARGLANQLQQLVEKLQQPHVHSADAIQDISRCVTHTSSRRSLLSECVLNLSGWILSGCCIWLLRFTTCTARCRPSASVTS